MKIAITGTDTLAAATRVCVSEHFPISAVGDADLVWVCEDTPIGQDGQPQSQYVIERIRLAVKESRSDSLVLVSAQMPIGTTRALEREFPTRSFGCSPENIRVASAIADFSKQARIVVGLRATDWPWQEKLHKVLSHFTDKIIFTDPETAEMAKHALNCYLGLSIAFINEISRLCSVTGANMDTITEALRTERRISPNAPLKAGDPFGGGHLARDIHVLSDLAEAKAIHAPLIRHILRSNGS